MKKKTFWCGNFEQRWDAPFECKHAWSITLSSIKGSSVPNCNEAHYKETCSREWKSEWHSSVYSSNGTVTIESAVKGGSYHFTTTTHTHTWPSLPHTLTKCCMLISSDNFTAVAGQKLLTSTRIWNEGWHLCLLTEIL